MSSGKEKKIIGNSNFINVEQLQDFLEVLKKCTCKIITNDGIGSGFFCKLNISDINNIQRPFLMTNNHVIDEDYLNSYNILRIEVNKKKKILLNLRDRIKLTDVKNDFTIIEIKHFDRIFDFFEISHDIIKNNYKNTLTETDVIIPQYPGGNNLSVAFGAISRIEEEDIYYTVSTDFGSSGSPILLTNNLELIGLHKQRVKDSNENCGTYIENILTSIEEMANERNINMLEEQKELNISNLELIKSIKCDDCDFKEIIFLKDGRLCSMDNNDNIKIYNKKNFKVEIEINQSDLPDTYANINSNNRAYTEEIHHKLGCTNDNELFFYSKNCIFIVIISLKEYNIIQQFPFENYNFPNLYLYKDKIILSDLNSFKEFTKEENGYRLTNEFISHNIENSCEFSYKEKFKYNDSIIKVMNMNSRVTMSLYKISQNDNNENIKGGWFDGLGYFHKNQKVFIEPSYLIIGDSEILFNLDNLNIEYNIIQKKAFKDNSEKIQREFPYNYDNDVAICYENLSESSFIYLNSGSYLSQINIIKNDNNFDLNIVGRREDIKGNYFIRKDDILFILSGDTIKIFSF